MKYLAAFLLYSLLAAAQSMSIPSPMTLTLDGQKDAQGNAGGMLTVSARLPIPPALIGAPFSGEEWRKPSPVVMKVARDAMGRTRVEWPMISSLIIVELNDPVAGYYYVLDPAKKIAYRWKYTPAPAQMILRSPPPVAREAAPVTATLIPGGRPELQPQVLGEPLGSRMMHGFQAEGRRQTTLLPAGARGNDRPVTEVTETWSAPALQLTLLQTTKSPSGNFSYELGELSGLNPTGELFRPPAGYTIRDEPATYTVEFGNRPVRGTATSSFRINNAVAPGTQR